METDRKDVQTMKKVVPILLMIGLILCALIGGLGYTAYKKYAPVKERADLTSLYGASGDEVALFLDDELQEAKGSFQNGQVYLPVSWVNQNLNERFYWDANEQLLVYTLPESIVYMDRNTRGESGAPVIITRANAVDETAEADEEENVYLSEELIAEYTDVRLTAFAEDGVHQADASSEKGAGNQTGEKAGRKTGNAPETDVKRMFVDRKWETEEWTALKSAGAVRERGGIKSLVVVQEPKGAKVRVLETMERWAKVRTEDGHMGYIEKRRLGDSENVTYISTFEAPVYTSISMEEKVCLVWHQVTSMEANRTLTKLLNQTKGVNVVSPTWFALTDNEGNFTSLADRSYVDSLHNQGIQVWALIDNFSKDVQTEILLSRTSVRQKLISGLMEQVETYDLDGLNLDFESLKESAGPHYIQFIRELSVACRQKQIVLSVDNYVPASYNAYYNRREQGIVADYVIIMGYDEHYSGGEAGPVASYPYVKNGIEGTLKEVPKNKVINAIPFYTRVWKEHADGTTSSDALGIADAKAWVDSNQVSLHWQDEIGLYYGEISNAEVRKEIWLEEETSIGLKMDLIRDYDLAGVACWKLGFEPASIWEVVKVNE